MGHPHDAVNEPPVDACGFLHGLVIGDAGRPPQSPSDAMGATGMTRLRAVSADKDGG